MEKNCAYCNLNTAGQHEISCPEDPIYTFTSNMPVEFDLNQTERLMRDIQKQFLIAFAGVPVAVDPNLKGNSYYIAVSKDVYNQLEAQESQ